MLSSSKTGTTISCVCGTVAIETIGPPITSAVCYCDDCQEGARQLQALANASAVQDRDGGTAYVLYRKDRAKVLKGAALLHGHKIREKTASRRVVATCCNSPMYLGFEDARHWISMYRARFPEDAPKVQMRICTKFAPEPSQIPRDVPSARTFPPRFMAQLLGSRIAMLLRR